MRTRTEAGVAKSWAWVFPSAMVAGLSVLFFWEWHAAREQSERTGKEIVEALRAFEHQARQDNKEMQALSRSLRSRLGTFEERVVTEMSALKRGTEEALAGRDPRETSRVEEETLEEAREREGEDPIDAELARLPPLPEGVVPTNAIEELTVEQFLADARYNPKGRNLTREQTAKANKDVAAARARMEVIETEVQLAVVQGMEKMREEGYYTEYAPGEVPEPVEGLVTAGEPTEDRGMRLFPFWEEDFPEIYEKRDEKKKVAELTLRRLLSMVADEQEQLLTE